MPCTYTGSLEGDQIMSLETTRDRLKDELDRMTRMLCALCTQIYKNRPIEQADKILIAAGRNADGLLENDILKWWMIHEAMDKARKP